MSFDVSDPFSSASSVERLSVKMMVSVICWGLFSKWKLMCVIAFVIACCSAM